MGLNSLQADYIMRIYLEGVNPGRGVDTAQFPRTTGGSLTRLYSDEGIFSVDQGRIQKIQVSDRPCEKVVVGGVKAVIDHSEFKSNRKVLHVPPVCHTQSLSVTKLMLREQARIWVVMEEERGKTDSIYLETHESLDNPLIREDFVTLVSKLKISQPIVDAPMDN
jgi:hypothetical protein